MTREGEKAISRATLALFVAGLLLCLPASASAATIAPNSTADDSVADGDCSLRDAFRSMINEVDQDTCVSTGTYGAGDTIQLAAGANYLLDQNGAGGVNDSQFGDLDTDGDDLTISGNAANRPTIRGDVGFDDRILHVPDASTSLTLTNLIIDEGNRVGLPADGQLGGNIYYRGGTGDTLALTNVDVTDGITDTNSPGDNGGGIAADGGGQVTLSDSLVSGNVAGVSTGNSYFGGGIYITGAGTDLTISNNSAVGMNQAGFSDGVTTVSSGQGGGIFVDATNSTVNISGTAIDGNTAGGGADGVDGIGGGIGVSSGSANLSLGPNVSLSNNVAGGNFIGADGQGGGIYAQGAGTLTVGDNVVVAGNEAGGDGAEPDNAGPSADGDGGGIFSDKAITMTGGAFVSSNNAGFGLGSSGQGGGILVTDSVVSPMSLTDVVMNDNDAGTGSGIAGAIFNGNSAPMTISASRITNNSAIDQGGAIYRAPPVGSTPSDSISTTTFSGNAANLFGGAIATFSDGGLSVERSTLTENEAGGGGLAGTGGGLSLNPAGAGSTASVTIENSTIHDNTAFASGLTGGDGGGINLVSDVAGTAPDLTIRSSTITDNLAAAGGGPGEGGNLRVAPTFPSPALVTVEGSIVSGGQGTGGAENCSSSFGTFVSNGGNIEGPPSTMPGQCSFAHASDQVGVNPMLGPLQDNGGPTETRAITVASPAFNAVPTALCSGLPTVDQRGSGRPSGGGCDSGAFELFVAPVTPPVITPTPPPVTTPTPTPPAKKKCKKGRKLKKGKCVKKKRKKK